MITTSQKQFILDTLLPYLKNPDTCGYDKENNKCLYLTSDGKKCAVGKHMKEGKWQKSRHGFLDLLVIYKKEDFFTQEALEQNLSDEIWKHMQGLHDCIPKSWENTYQIHLDELERLTGVEFPELKK